MSGYTLTFHAIKCLRPSASTNLPGAQEAKTILEGLSKGLDVASKIADITGPEGEVAGVVLEVAGTLAELGGAIDDLIVQIDAARRDAGLDPDDLYISICIPGPTTAEDGAWVMYPAPGFFRSQNEPTTPLAKGASAPNLPFSSPITPGNTVACLWDHDNGSGDDLLVSLPIDPGALGRFQKTFYNAMQDCMYYVDWELVAA